LYFEAEIRPNREQRLLSQNRLGQKFQGMANGEPAPGIQLSELLYEASGILLSKREHMTEEKIMKVQSRAALAVLALALSCTPMLAQGDPPDAPADQPGPPDGFGPPRPPMVRRMGPDAGRGGWGHMRGGFERDGRMGMDGFRRGGQDAGLARLLSDPAIRQQVGISDAQAATIRQQESDFRKAEIRNRADLEVKRIDLRDLLAADKPDRAAIDGKLQEISAAQLVLAKAAVDHMLTMRDAITSAQRDKLRQLMRDRRGRGVSREPGPGAQTSRRRGQRGAAPGGGANAPAPPQPGTPPTQ
jgi:Spy/CpxP family protein refolding chaperone